MPKSAPLENKYSIQLTKEENESVFRLLGNRCQALSTTVIQLFTTDGPHDNEWHKRCFGVLCLVKDNPRRSYFFRLYCPARRQLIWEHEIYKGMDYQAPKHFLHTFEGEDCIVGFNFASEDEARHLRSVILEKQRRLERRHRTSAQPRHSSTPNYDREKSRTLHYPHKPTMTNGTATLPSPNLIRSASTGHSKKDAKKKASKLTKADISSPTEFRHISHVGWDPDKGFDADIQKNPELKVFFEKAGVSQSQLQDKDTREFIYNFLNEYGGIDAAKKEAQLPPPPVPARSVCVSNARHAPPPPPPPTVSRQQNISSVPQSNNIPPPLPPLRTMPTRGASGMHIPPPPPNPPPIANIPPPPPTLPSQGVLVPPPPPQVAQQPDPRSALMDAIRSGTKLKPVDPDSKKNTLNNDSRGELLDQIRQGVELKSVQPAPKAPTTLQSDGLAGALARALAERSRVIHSDSDSTSDTDEENEEDDEEWED